MNKTLIKSFEKETKDDFFNFKHGGMIGFDEKEI